MLREVNAIYLNSQTPTTIERHDLAEVLQLLAAREPVLVMAPRHSGLSTILTQASNHYRAVWNLQNCYVNCRDLRHLSEGQWLKEVSARLAELLPSGLQAAPCDNTFAFRRFLLNLLAVLPGQVLLVLDDLDLLPSSLQDTWLELLRSIYQESFFQPIWQKFRCLMGSHDVADYEQISQTGDLSHLAWMRLDEPTVDELEAWTMLQTNDASLSMNIHLTIKAWTRGNLTLMQRIMEKFLAARTDGNSDQRVLTGVVEAITKNLGWPQLTAAEERLLDDLLTQGSLSRANSPPEKRLQNEGLIKIQAGKVMWYAAMFAASYRQRQSSNPLEHPPSELVLDYCRMEARYRGRLLPLFPQELKILFLLAEKPGRYFSPEAIYRMVSDDPLAGELGVVSVKSQIARLRRKLPSPSYITTRRNIGYALNPQLPFDLIS